MCPRYTVCSKRLIRTGKIEEGKYVCKQTRNYLAFWLPDICDCPRSAGPVNCSHSGPVDKEGDNGSQGHHFEGRHQERAAGTQRQGDVYRSRRWNDERRDQKSSARLPEKKQSRNDRDLKSRHNDGAWSDAAYVNHG